jgi:hypothetical protein
MTTTTLFMPHSFRDIPIEMLNGQIRAHAARESSLSRLETYRHTRDCAAADPPLKGLASPCRRHNQPDVQKKDSAMSPRQRLVRRFDEEV